MLAVEPMIWNQGFAAGEAIAEGHRCPYRDRSHEARSWLLGWAQGVRKMLGQRYSAAPADEAQADWADAFED